MHRHVLELETVDCTVDHTDKTIHRPRHTMRIAIEGDADGWPAAVQRMLADLAEDIFRPMRAVKWIAHCLRVEHSRDYHVFGAALEVLSPEEQLVIEQLRGEGVILQGSEEFRVSIREGKLYVTPTRLERADG